MILYQAGRPVHAPMDNVGLATNTEMDTAIAGLATAEARSRIVNGAMQVSHRKMETHLLRWEPPITLPINSYITRLTGAGGYMSQRVQVGDTEWIDRSSSHHFDDSRHSHDRDGINGYFSITDRRHQDC